MNTSEIMILFGVQTEKEVLPDENGDFLETDLTTAPTSFEADRRSGAGKE